MLDAVPLPVQRTARHLLVPLAAAGALSLVQCGAAQPLSSLPPPPAPAQASQPAATELAWQPTPDAPFRQQPPEAGPEAPWLAPIPDETKLSNGISVLLVPRPKLPIVVVQVVSRRGADQQPYNGLGAFMGAMLEQGTKARSALQLSDAYRDIGAEHGAYVDWDSAAVWVKVLPAHLDKALDILSDVVRNPAFAPDEIERQRSQRLAAIRQQTDQPAVVLGNTVARTLYPGQHVYGESILGTVESVTRASRAGLQSFHRQVFAPSDVFVVVVGNVEATGLQQSLERAFGNWRQPSPPRKAVRTPPTPARSVVLVDRPGAAQSSIAVAGLGVPRTTPDFDQLLLANTILGGMFSSRLNLNLREKHAFTYGAYSYFDMRHGPGPFRAGAAVDTPNTGAALREMLSELQRFCSGMVTDQEVQLALGRQVKSLPGRFETDSETATSISDLGVFKLPLDEFRTRPERLARVTPQQVREAAAKHMDPQKMKIVVVGDRKRIEADLQALHFGPIVVTDEQGKVLETIPPSGPLASLSCEPTAR